MKVKHGINLKIFPNMNLNTKRYILLIFLLYFYSTSYSQSKSRLNFWLKRYLEQVQDDTQQLHLLVIGDPQQIKTYVLQNQGHYKYALRDISSVSIPVNKVELLSQQTFVSRIEFSGVPGQVLNDSMRVRVRVDSVHAAYAPINDSLMGEGIIIGIVDEDLEVHHPDLRNADGTSRVKYYWNQNVITGTAPSPYNYGSEWNESDINADSVVKSGTSDHGSHVTGIAAGNGRAVGHFKGVAPKADLIFVDYYEGTTIDFTQSVADAVHYIFTKADQLNKPCVVNLSLGTYIGSHDGSDAAAQMIDQLIDGIPGRAVVCAAGNSGSFPPYHLSYPVSSDTNFTWFKYIPDPSVEGVFFELYADTQDFNQVHFSIGADRVSPSFAFRGETSFEGIEIGNTVQNLVSTSGNYLAKVQTYAEIQGDKYFLQVYVSDVDSTQYLYRFSTTGSGRFDIWSHPGLTGTSEIASSANTTLPSVAQFADMALYQYPDQQKTTVSSWACSPHVITVGNYVNRDTYIDYDGNLQVFAVDPGELFSTSSKGPTRDNRIKPDITAPGSIVLSCARLENLAIDTTVTPSAVAQGGYHKRNTGTSMASPVIAGLAALYFEKCPTKTAADFYTDLTATAFEDGFTGLTPSNSWGYGKPNAFGLLKRNNVELNLIGHDTTVCSFVELEAGPDSVSFYWPDGDTTSTKIIKSEGFQYVTNLNDGCYSKSKMVYVNLTQSDTAYTSISTTDNTTFCHGDSVTLTVDSVFSAYLWSTGEFSREVHVKETGLYYAYGLDSNNCFTFSDSINIIVLASPPKPSITNMGTFLSSSVAYQYQWYKRGVLLTDSVEKTIYPNSSGWYQVEVFHINGCSTFSDSVYYSAIGIEDPIHDQIHIYPNPTSGLVYIKGLTQKTDVLVFNIQGQRVQHFTLNKVNNYLNLNQLPSGVYTLKISLDQGNMLVHKLILN